MLKVKGCVLHTVHEPPVEERVVHKGLQHGHQTVLVFPQYLHHTLTGHLVVTIDTCHLATNTQRVRIASYDILRYIIEE